jgi:hypothetical protein
MKKFMVSFIFILFIFGSAAAMTLNLDLSESSIAPTGQETITINNLSASVDGMPLSGKYWIEFVWDPVNLVFVPVDAGEEIPPKTQYWSFNAGSSSHRFDINWLPIRWTELSMSPIHNCRGPLMSVMRRFLFKGITHLN